MVTGNGVQEEKPIVRTLPQSPTGFLNFAKNIMFLLGSVVVIFIAFRNTLTWHAQKFWGASADFWEHLWGMYLDVFIRVFGESNLEIKLMTWGSSLVVFLVYWSLGAIYTFFDYFNVPEWIRKYKIQPGTNEPVERRRLLQVVGQVLVNQIVVGVPFAFVTSILLKARGCTGSRKLPYFEEVVFELIIMVIVEEAMFYYSHRLLHHKLLYKYIHKQHHEWTAPISVTAIYCHPLEHLFSNLLGPFAGVLVCGSHIATQYLWFSMAIANTLNAHSGYHLPFFPSPEAHDFHHLKIYNPFFSDGAEEEEAGEIRNVTYGEALELAEQGCSYATICPIRIKLLINGLDWIIAIISAAEDPINDALCSVVSIVAIAAWTESYLYKGSRIASGNLDCLGVLAAPGCVIMVSDIVGRVSSSAAMMVSSAAVAPGERNFPISSVTLDCLGVLAAPGCVIMVSDIVGRVSSLAAMMVSSAAVAPGERNFPISSVTSENNS
ncbi:unnamed protein product, partial [Notodromas monacha]